MYKFDCIPEMEMWETMLPNYLVNDLKEFISALKRHDISIDLYYDEVYGSINSAYHDGVISFEDAAYLRDKYLGIWKEILLILMIVKKEMGKTILESWQEKKAKEYNGIILKFIEYLIEYT